MPDWKNDLLKVTDFIRAIRACEDKKRRLDIFFSALNLAMVFLCGASGPDSWWGLYVIGGGLAAYCFSRVAHYDREELANLRIETRVAFALALERIANETFDPNNAYFEFETLASRFRAMALWYRPPGSIYDRPFARAVYGPHQSPQEPSNGSRLAGEHPVVLDDEQSPDEDKQD